MSCLEIPLGQRSTPELSRNHPQKLDFQISNLGFNSQYFMVTVNLDERKYQSLMSDTFSCTSFYYEQCAATRPWCWSNAVDFWK